MKIYFVRHGKTQGNAEQRYNIGDEVLNESGKQDLVEKRTIYQDIDFDYIYCSTMTRCRESFDILFPDLEVDEYRDDIVEMNFGDWSGTKYIDIVNELKAQGYQLGDLVDPPNGEPFESLFARTTNFLQEIIEKAQPDETILIMTHGLVISSIMKKHFLQDEVMYHLAPQNGYGYEITIDGDKHEVRSIGETLKIGVE